MILFMIWLYLAWLILLIGASISFYQQHPEYLNQPRSQAAGPGNRMREWIGLYCLGLIARQHHDGEPPLLEKVGRQRQREGAEVQR